MKKVKFNKNNWKGREIILASCFMLLFARIRITNDVVFFFLEELMIVDDTVD